MVMILLDTNFLLLPVEFNLDIFAEIARIMEQPYQLHIIDKTVDELNNLIETGKTKQKLAAKMAKKMLNTYPIKIIETDKQKHVDLLILEKLEPGAIVATQDADLKRRLRARKIPHIVMRSKQHLELVPA